MNSTREIDQVRVNPQTEWKNHPNSGKYSNLHHWYGAKEWLATSSINIRPSFPSLGSSRMARLSGSWGQSFSTTTISSKNLLVVNKIVQCGGLERVLVILGKDDHQSQEFVRLDTCNVKVYDSQKIFTSTPTRLPFPHNMHFIINDDS